MSKPKILYVLGLAFSGSTLFGLSMGRHSRVLNLGEVANLENDFHPLTRCTCGNVLKNCKFWTRLKPQIEAHQAGLSKDMKWDLSETGSRSLMDQKSGKGRLRTLFGASPFQVYGDHAMAGYRKRNETFFNAVSQSLPKIKLIVDLSKSSERLDALSGSNELDIWAVYLKRNPVSTFHSNLKRPKKTRSGWGPKIVREAVLQRQRTMLCEKAIESFPPERRLVVSYEEFTSRPTETVDSILKKTGVEPEPVDYSSAFDLKSSGQHIYVGNRWLFAEDVGKIKIQPTVALPKLTFWERQMLRFALGTRSRLSSGVVE